MHATMNSAAAAARATGPVHSSSTTTTGTSAIRNSESRFGSASTAALVPTVSAMGRDDDDTRVALAGPLTEVVLPKAANPSMIIARFGDVWDPPRSLDALGTCIVRRDGVRHVPAIAVEQPLEMPDPALDVVARLEDVLHSMLSRRRRHELHEALRALRRNGLVVEVGL